MVTTVSGNTTDSRLVHPLNAKFPMLATPSGSTKHVLSGLSLLLFLRAMQPSNAASPMVVTVSGNTTDFRLVQFSNAEIPMLVKPDSIINRCKLLLSENAYWAIDFTSWPSNFDGITSNPETGLASIIFALLPTRSYVHVMPDQTHV